MTTANNLPRILARFRLRPLPGLIREGIRRGDRHAFNVARHEYSNYDTLSYQVGDEVEVLRGLVNARIAREAGK